MEDQSKLGIVYVLTNPAMPGLVKIGKTTRDDVESRLKELYSTGVPVPFECAYAGRVVDESKVERAFHLAFGPYRLNSKREFFQIEPEQAIALLELMSVENVTPTLQAEANSVDIDAKDASRKLKSRRPNLNFIEMGIQIGSELEFAVPEVSEIIRVVSDRKVDFRGEEAYLTSVTRELLELEYSVNPSPYWLYQGRSLSDIYDETYDPYASQE